MPPSYRLNHRSVQLGFPEVTLGLLPGGGGNVKAVYLMGLMAANEYIVEGKRVAPGEGLGIRFDQRSG